MKRMTLKERLEVLENAGDLLAGYANGEQPDEWEQLKQRAFAANGWFSPAQVDHALRQWAKALSRDNIQRWASAYPGLDKSPENPVQVGIVMAGNIPAAGLHDVLSCILTGNSALCRLATPDALIIPFLITRLANEQPALNELVRFTEGRLSGCDAYIATGSAGTARQFREFFGKYPSLIRQHRNSTAVITGKETPAQMTQLGHDIFTYYGLGCRSVSKLYVPTGYDPDHFFTGIFSFAGIAENKKYGNNYDYYTAAYLLNDEDLLDNGFLLYRENPSYASAPATIHWETYSDLERLKQRLDADAEILQCVVKADTSDLPGSIPFGTTQSPMLWDYADNIDTVKFLQTTSGTPV